MYKIMFDGKLVYVHRLKIMYIIHSTIATFIN